MNTTISITEETKSILDKKKIIDRETYNDVIVRMIREAKWTKKTIRRLLR